MDDNLWLSQFPDLESIEDPQRIKLLETSNFVSLPAGANVFQQGDDCSNFLLVIEGSVRVQKLSESGREIVLYRVEHGQSCILTTSCLLSGDHYSAEAVTETPVKAVVIPASTFNMLLDYSGIFRHFVFNSYSRRIADLLLLIDAISFGRIDVRLASHLLHSFDADGALKITHHELARDLGSAREVVSRILKEFERKGIIELARGHIRLLDAGLLENQAQV